MSKNKCIIIGISGITCGGKTTLAVELNKFIPGSCVISQDNYFWDVGDPHHVWIPELNHINFDIISSLDMGRMHMDILQNVRNRDYSNSKINVNLTKNQLDLINGTGSNNLQKLIFRKIQQAHVNVLIIEGFCIFNYEPIANLCNLKYYFTLTKDECYTRRIKRVYEPPDCPGYFEKCVWPEYLNLYDEVKRNVKNITYFDGTLKSPIERVLGDIYMLG